MLIQDISKDMIPNTLNEAVSVYLEYLGDQRRHELLNVYLNTHVSWSWYQEVIELFQLRDSSSLLIKDIEEKNPDAEFMRAILSDFEGPFFEAHVILEAAKESYKTTWPSYAWYLS